MKSTILVLAILLAYLFQSCAQSVEEIINFRKEGVKARLQRDDQLFESIMEKLDAAERAIDSKIEAAKARGDIETADSLLGNLITIASSGFDIYNSSNEAWFCLINRAWYRSKVGNFAGAEEDLLESLSFTKRHHSNTHTNEIGINTSTVYMFKSTYVELTYFYAATGNIKRAIQAFDAAKYYEREIERCNAWENETNLAQSIDAEYTRDSISDHKNDMLLHYAVEKLPVLDLMCTLGLHNDANLEVKKILSQITEAWESERLRLERELEKSNKKPQSQAPQFYNPVYWEIRYREYLAEGRRNYLYLRTMFLFSESNILINLGKTADATRVIKSANESADETIKEFEARIAYLKTNPISIENERLSVPEDWQTAEWEKQQIEQATQDIAGEISDIEYKLPKLRYLSYVASGIALFRAGDSDAALHLVDRGLQQADNYRDFEPSGINRFNSREVRPDLAFKLRGDIRASDRNYTESIDDYDLALEFNRKLFSGENTTYAEILESKALVRFLQGNSDEVFAVANKAVEMRLGDLMEVLEYGDESQRLAYRSSQDLWSMYGTIGRHEELAQTVFRTKGVVIESIANDRSLIRSLEKSQGRNSVGKLQSLRRSLLALSLTPGDSGGSNREEIKRQINDLERTLLDQDGLGGLEPDFLKINSSDIQRALPEGASLVEFFRYHHYEAPSRGREFYGAIILSQVNPPAFVRLSPTSEIDALVEEYSDLVRNEVADEKMEKNLQELSDAILKPMEPVLPQGGRIIIAPDGALNFVSFASLLANSGEFLGESRIISYVSTGRDLLRNRKMTDNRSAVIFSDPDFDSASVREHSIAATERNAAMGLRGNLSGIQLPRLPGTMKESDMLKALFSGGWSLEVDSFSAIHATEKSLFRVDSPLILHLATHGFFLPAASTGGIGLSPVFDSSDSGDAGDSGGEKGNRSSVILENPMHRSGLALAGANSTFKDWEAGSIGDTSSDGVVSAEELSELNLDGTWLVVLSACDTGSGEALSGEGVLGIRRGLAKSGAKNLLLTLWPVADEETVEIMNEFYVQLDRGETDPGSALAVAQRKYLEDYRKSRGLSAAVRLAGPFVLSQQN